ncbi:zinc ribbon domain-containing protein [Oxynema aestuarii]|nr:zinc ribbon domain-containing protein [Oxynema aestuarii]
MRYLYALNIHRQKMPLDKRQYDCPSCHASIDRDLNAAINVENAESSAV